MLFNAALVVAAALAPALAVPTLRVPACPAKGTVTYNQTVPDKASFPKTQVDVCYSATAIQYTFTAYEEKNFYYNASQTTNGNIWEYEVMEAFIHRGLDDPATYLEIEVNPGNVTFQSFIYNPSKVRTPGTPFDHAFIEDPIGSGFLATTKLDKAAEKWTSTFSVPLALFNVDAGKAKGTAWRMNFFRTVVSPETFPDQGLGSWSPPNQASFHMTPFFGKVFFV